MTFDIGQARQELIRSSVEIIESTFKLAQFHDDRYHEIIENRSYDLARKSEFWADFRTMRLRIIRGDCHEDIALDVLKKYPNSVYIVSESLVDVTKSRYSEHIHQISGFRFFDNPDVEELEFQTALALQGGLEIMLIDRGLLSYNDINAIMNMGAILTVFLGSVTLKEETDENITLTRML